MLIHITPRILIPKCQVWPECKLLDFSIEELGLKLLGGKDLTVRRPYPNKRYQVGCRNEGLSAAVGVFIETPDQMNTFTSTAHWLVSDRRIITHKVTHIVLDNDFDAVSDNMMLWGSWENGTKAKWGSRWPNGIRQNISDAQPRMDLTPGTRDVTSQNTLFDDGDLKSRHEIYSIPTIERVRLTSLHGPVDRLPKIRTAFVVAANQCTAAA